MPSECHHHHANSPIKSYNIRRKTLQFNGQLLLLIVNHNIFSSTYQKKSDLNVKPQPEHLPINCPEVSLALTDKCKIVFIFSVQLKSSSGFIKGIGHNSLGCYWTAQLLIREKKQNKTEMLWNSTEQQRNVRDVSHHINPYNCCDWPSAQKRVDGSLKARGTRSIL